MRRVIAFEQVSLDGYFVDANGDMSWAHKDPADAEWNAFVGSNASGGGALLFGRITYEMMASFWPTPAAMEMLPDVAEGMNQMPKIVFSRTLEKASWKNTTLMKGDLAAEVRKLKQESGPAITILGSGSIVSQLAQAGLIDEYKVVVNPLVLGKGRTMFEGVSWRPSLRLAGMAAEDIGKCAYGIFRRGKEMFGKTIGIAGGHLICAEMAEGLGKALGKPVRYNEITPEAYRGLGFPGADDLGNMFQVYRDFEKEVCGLRNLDVSRSLNPELQTFEQWLAKNKERLSLD